jgi:thymidylate kinase
LAAADPDRWVTVDGSAPVDEVTAAVRAAVTARCPDLAPAAGDG